MGEGTRSSVSTNSPYEEGFARSKRVLRSFWILPIFVRTSQPDPGCPGLDLPNPTRVAPDARPRGPGLPRVRDLERHLNPTRVASAQPDPGCPGCDSTGPGLPRLNPTRVARVRVTLPIAFARNAPGSVRFGVADVGTEPRVGGTFGTDLGLIHGRARELKGENVPSETIVEGVAA